MTPRKYFYIVMMILCVIAAFAASIKGDLGFTLLDTFLALLWGVDFLEEKYK